MPLDIGIGILLALAVGKLFALPFSFSLVSFFVVTGVFFSLLMDVDALINVIIHRGTHASYKHRDLLHLPLIYIPVGMLLTFVLASAFSSSSFAIPLAIPFTLPFALPLAIPLTVLFGLCSLAHFIHDSIGLGWGVKWLYPFSNNQYSFFYQYNAHRAGLRPTKSILKKVLGLKGIGLYVWKPDEIDLLEEKYGDKDWFKHIYMSMHPYSLVEIGVFLLALVTLAVVAVTTIRR